MSLDRNQETFPTYMHRRIWGQWAKLVPLEKTLPFVDEAYKKSCVDLHNFFSAVFEDMYENIEAYDLLPNGIPENSHDAILLKKQPEQPFWFFHHLALQSGIDENGNMVLSAATFAKLKKMRKELYATDMLSKHGIVISEFPDITVISNTKYPDIFRIMMRMASNGKTKYNLRNCDFRVFNEVKLDGFELLTETLSDKQKKIAIEIDEFLCGKGVKREKNLTVGRIIYRYNKEIIAYMDREDNQLVVPVIFLDYRNYMSFEDLCAKIDAYENRDALKQFAFENQKICSGCPDLHCDFFIKYDNKKLKVCTHRGGVYFTDFSEQNMEYLKQLIQLKINCSNTAEGTT